MFSTISRPLTQDLERISAHIKDFDSRSWKDQCPYQGLWLKILKGSVPLRHSEKIRKFENKNCVHCLVSLCSSFIKLLYEKNYQCSKLNTCLVTTFLSEWGYCVYIEIPLILHVSPTQTFRTLTKYECSFLCTSVNIGWLDQLSL